MFSNIVVGTNGSPRAKTAVTMAVALARLSGATVHLVYAVKVPPIPTSVGHLGDPVIPGVVKDAVDAVLTEAAALADGVTVETYAASFSPADAVIRIAEQVGADLVVIGAKGTRGTRRLIGSIPSAVANGAPCPVLIAKSA
jgi:nucleotide-binding universal stress UspA family protein